MNKSCSMLSWPKLVRNLGYGVFAGCLIIAFTAWNVFKLYPISPRLWQSFFRKSFAVNLQLPTGADQRTLRLRSHMNPDSQEPHEPWPPRPLDVHSEEPHEPQMSNSEMKVMKPLCYLTHPRSDVCDLNGDIRVHGDSSTIFIASTDNGNMFKRNVSWSVKPYARKGDDFAMRSVRTITIRATQISESFPKCSRKYAVPAIFFSTAGYTRNYFHGFTDVLIPLFSTSMEFNRRVQFLVTDKEPSWSAKFKHLLRKLSRYKLIDIDNQTDQVLCFPRIIVGLKGDKEFSIDSSSSKYSMRDFTKFLRCAYSLKRTSSVNVRRRKKPRLLIISRRKTRNLVNEEQIARMAKGLGFKVVVNETGTDIRKVAKFINSFDVLMGVHGAGLSNMVFLPENAVVIQIIPFGITKWLARFDFKAAAEDMNLRYLDYMICPNESSLIQRYPYDRDIFKDSLSAFDSLEWNSLKERFRRKQDVKLDLTRFKNILSEARKLSQT